MKSRRKKPVAALGIASLILVGGVQRSHASEPPTLMSQFEDLAQITPGERVLRMDLDVTGDGRP
jgi:hypothetical protein